MDIALDAFRAGQQFLRRGMRLQEFAEPIAKLLDRLTIPIDIAARSLDGALTILDLIATGIQILSGAERRKEMDRLADPAEKLWEQTKQIPDFGGKRPVDVTRQPIRLGIPFVGAGG